MKSPKLMVIGWDSVSLTLLDTFKDCTPNLRRLMARGATGHAIPEFPMYTPTNWAVLASGADSSTTAAEGWSNNVAGRPLSTFDRRAIPCDTIFDAAARAKLRTLAITYPGAYPPNSTRNMVLAPLDRGLTSNMLVPGKLLDVTPDADGRFEFVLLAQPKQLSGAAMAKLVGATEDGAGAETGAKRRTVVRDVPAALERTGKAAWKLTVTTRGGDETLRLRHEKWSEPIPVRVAAPGRPGRCVVRVMVFDAGKRLAVSEAYDIGQLGTPKQLARDIYAQLGPPTEHSVFYGEMTRLFRHGKADKTVTRLAEAELNAQADWIVAAAAATMKARPYDVFYLHHHYPDSVLHAYLPALSGSPKVTAAQRRLAREAMQMAMRICDRLTGKLLELAGAKTTVLVVSDHGNVMQHYNANVEERLIETGLLVRKSDGSPDRRRSTAWPTENRFGVALDVNAREGTSRYAELQEQVIDALLNWKDPEGKRVIALALRKKDAHLLGYHGPRCGDVVFHYNSGYAWFGPAGRVLTETYGANHGPQMPVTFTKVSDNMSFFVLAGPRVRKGLRHDIRTAGPLYLRDMVPTLCAAANVPPPRDVRGAVRYDLLKS